MKKTLALLLTFAMLISCMSFSVAAEETEGTLLFNLGISKSEDSVLINDQTGKVSDIWSRPGTANVKSYVNRKGETVDYISFDGTFNGIGVKDDSFAANDESFTIEFWAKAPNNVWGRVVNWGNLNVYPNKSNFGGFVAQSTDSNVGGDANSNCSAAMSEWSHYALTRNYDGETITQSLYINGFLFKSVSGALSSYTALGNILYIGARDSSLDKFNGDLASMKIYAGASAASVVRSHYASERDSYMEQGNDNLLFESDLSTGVLTDKTAKNNSVYLQNVTYSSFENLTGEKIPTVHFNTASEATDSSKYLSRAIGFAATKTGTYMGSYYDRTIELWTNVEYCDTWQRLYQDGTKNESAYLNNGTLYWDVQGPSGKARAVQTNVAAYCGKWAHWVFVREYNDATSTFTYTVYINGTKISSGSTTGVPQVHDLYIAGFYGASARETMHGDIASAKVYGLALTASAIKAKYKADKTTYQTDATDIGSLVLDLGFTPGATGKASITDKTKLHTDFWAQTAWPTVSSMVSKNGETAYATVNKAEDTTQHGYNVTMSEWQSSVIARNSSTVEAWVRPEGLTTEGRWSTLYWNYGSGTNNDMGVQMFNNTLRFTYNTNRAVDVNIADYDGKWTHMAFVVNYNEDADSVSGAVYINGELKAESIIELRQM